MATEKYRFKKGHTLSQKPRRNLAQSIKDNVRPTYGKRQKLSRHFGIESTSWTAIKEAAKKYPGMVKAWDMGIRPSRDADKVKLVENKNNSKYDRFVVLVFENPTMGIEDLAKKSDLPIGIAMVWAAEVKASERFREFVNAQEKEIEKQFALMVNSGLQMLNSEKAKMDSDEYINKLTKLSILYKNYQTGKTSNIRSEQMRQNDDKQQSVTVEAPKFDFGTDSNDDFDQGDL
jgi:hypothetical protein